LRAHPPCAAVAYTAFSRERRPTNGSRNRDAVCRAIADEAKRRRRPDQLAVRSRRIGRRVFREETANTGIGNTYRTYTRAAYTADDSSGLANCHLVALAAGAVRRCTAICSAWRETELSLKTAMAATAGALLSTPSNKIDRLTHRALPERR